MQLFLFGFAINSDPKHLPAGLLSIDDFEIHPHHRRRAQQFGLLRSSAAPLGSGGRSRACRGRPDVRHRDAAEFRPGGRSRRAARACSSTPTRPIRRPSAMRSRRSARSSRDLNRDLPPIRQTRAADAAVPVRRARALQSRAAHRAQCRARPHLHRADVLDAVRHHARDHAASGSAARWRTCSRCR